MTFINVLGIVLTVIILGTGIGVRKYTKRKIKDLEGFCGIIEP